ncbi:sterile alpha motif domain-containing 3-like protein [Labeo rohita]|uniref:Sterile alpha motif domain-containing 3-like protein n=1 Tax=Labeo rohita TaxID=84645 RepID=A0A498MDZ0_LABRO|nr:sterile alpha motif domain-containing 3-like protein [Labeo rohita]RXN39420.1 sterile alpha motif domain-containing 3-like protein [Labeo rohita]
MLESAASLDAQNEDINVKRDCVLRCLSVFLNEDLETLIKEYVDCEIEEAESGIAQTTMGDEPADVGVVL